MHDCSMPGRLIHLVTALFLAAGLFGCTTTQNTTPVVQTQVQPEKTVQPGPVRQPVYQDAVTVPYYPPPDRMDLCGERAPLDQPDVMERFDREFTLVLYSHAQVYRLLKRKAVYFSRFEESLRRLKLPDDLKYVALLESEVPANAVEQRKAASRRYDFDLATDNAFLYLGDLFRTYQSWALAIAAFNAGDKTIMEESRAQGVRDYYHMKLPIDAERYVFRILAIKAVLSDPGRYGYEQPKGAGRR